MVHNRDSKTEILKIRVDKELNDFLKLIADKSTDPKICKSTIELFFLKLGIFEAFSEHFHYDLSNFEPIFKILTKITEGHEFDRIINKVTYYNSVQK